MARKYRKRRVVTKELICEVARAYSSKAEFSNGDLSAYRAACRNGWLEEACAHMKVLRRGLGKEFIAEVARKFATRGEFYDGDQSAYCAAARNGWLDEVCSHMSAVNRSLDKESVMELARRFSTRTDFQLGDQSAYQTAWRNGWLAEACKHMVRGGTGFDDEKPGYLYQIEFALPSGDKVWKIGISNRRPKFRLAGMGIPDWIGSEITHEIKYDRGIDARLEESRLHKIGSVENVCYDGESFLKNGNTELFCEPLINRHFKI